MSYGVPMGPMGPLDRPVAVGAGLGGLRWPGWPIAAQIVIYRERTSSALRHRRRNPLLRERPTPSNLVTCSEVEIQYTHPRLIAGATLKL